MDRLINQVSIYPNQQVELPNYWMPSDTTRSWRYVVYIKTIPWNIFIDECKIMVIEMQNLASNIILNSFKLIFKLE